MPLSFSYLERGLVQVLLPHKIIPIIIIASIASAGVVAGLVSAPSSPGLPYVSPTYQAQKAPFQYQQIALNAAIYGVWYVPGTTTLILVIMASFPQTHFYGLWGPYGIVSPPGFNIKTTRSRATSPFQYMLTTRKRTSSSQQTPVLLMT